jgi:hypothetical protein
MPLPLQAFEIQQSTDTEPTINEHLAPSRHRDSSHPSAFADQIDDNPVALSQLQFLLIETGYRNHPGPRRIPPLVK